MRALVYYGAKDIRMADVDMAAYRDDEVLVRVKSTGICGSDVHGYLGITGRRIPPLIMGHEFTGVIEKAGKDVRGFSAGDRVAVFPEIYCGACQFCRNGMEHVCQNRKIFGVLTTNGSFTEYIAVPEKNLYHLPDNVTFEQGTLGEPLAVAVKAADLAGEMEGKNVLIIGAGIIGLLLLEAVKAKKPKHVFIADVKASRLEAAKKLGAQHIVDTSVEGGEKAITELVGSRGVDACIEAVGLTETVQYGLRHLRQKGVCVLLGLWKRFVEIDMHELVNNELAVFGSTLYTPRDYRRAIEMLKEGKVNTDVLITKVLPLEKGPEAFAALAEGSGNDIKVVLNS